MTPSDKQSIGIVGCGAIGRAILRAVEEGRLDVPVAGVTSRTEATARAFLATLRRPPPFLALDALVEQAGLIVEASGGATVPELARSAFAAGKDLMVISTGALLEHPELLAEARRRNCRLLLPSGAIAGVDGIKSACQGHVDHVTITTRKPPRGLAGAPYLVEHGIDMAAITEETEVYHGPVREACRGFPANVNVSATVSLAGVGPDRTMIRILAVPGLAFNCHTIEVAGEFGTLKVEITNIPTENPKTGRLTAMSIVRAIADAMDPVRVGT
ncbi:MAG TPA: aspartate dehydrogenase [bacterium]|nr:aspartate dehydrogenase [bacterium]